MYKLFISFLLFLCLLVIPACGNSSPCEDKEYLEAVIAAANEELSVIRSGSVLQIGNIIARDIADIDTWDTRYKYGFVARGQNDLCACQAELICKSGKGEERKTILYTESKNIHGVAFVSIFGIKQDLRSVDIK